MKKNLAYSLQISLEQLRTQAIDGIRALLEEANAHQVAIKGYVPVHYINGNAYSEVNELKITGECLIVNSYGEQEWNEMKYIPIHSLLHILVEVEAKGYIVIDSIEDKDPSNHIQAQEDAYFDNFCQQNNI